MLLQGCCLQHEVLLLGCVHLMQVLGRHALRSVHGMLDHLLDHTMYIFFRLAKSLTRLFIYFNNKI